MRWLVGLLVCGSLLGGDWTREDTIREGVVLGEFFVDWAQTRQIMAHGEKWEELNPLIGHQPGQVNRCIIGGALIHVGVAYLLPPDARRVFQYVTIGVEAGCIVNNYSIGVRIPF